MPVSSAQRSSQLRKTLRLWGSCLLPGCLSKRDSGLQNWCTKMYKKFSHLQLSSAMNVPQLSRKDPELIFAGGMVGCHGNGAGLDVLHARYMHGICMVYAWYGMPGSAEVEEFEDFGSLCKVFTRRAQPVSEAVGGICVRMHIRPCWDLSTSSFSLSLAICSEPEHHLSFGLSLPFPNFKKIESKEAFRTWVVVQAESTQTQKEN